ncbi:RNA polymerase factor sigma-54 [Methylonatrum kenyense]|uniref:RNA polymerase factor sigma-54 n=1 Tax=Methylonatrum kenyense TaxID=455253 RepID=UPI0020C07CAA|nr:RNA polymerase factor sigma-54 [Methylonatrum kenyense]MCK8516257.1 RNA polymerase factor sigma-54 [Methylonatrum kenyense]
MKQSLQLRLGQTLTMTPQLQQAIRLLQLSTLELHMEVQQALDSNLMLEPADDSDDGVEEREAEANGEDKSESAKAETAQADSVRDAAEREVDERSSSASSDDIPKDLPLDSDWGDIYDGTTSYSAPAPDEDGRDAWENQTTTGRNLQDHLREQASLARLSERDMAIAEAIIDSVRDDGYLCNGLDDIRSALPEDWLVETDEIEAVRHLIQRFDPLGVASLDPREALLLQLDRLDPDTPWLSEARQLVDQHLDLLASRQTAQLLRRLKLRQEDLSEVLALVRTLDPRPGSQISDSTAEYVIPDVYVRRDKDDWRVELNPEAAPRVRVNSYYASLVRRADNSQDNSTMRQHLQEARWFIKSLRSRNDTLLKVATCIVRHQREFFEHGEEAMKPLVLREVAEEVEMHESTISRITTSKYMHTPRGTFEFKYFFSSHVHTVDGDECSATSIRARIRRLIGEENPAKPLSDSRLADILKQEGINVARRTVAKYREAMSIASSNERKRIA